MCTWKINPKIKKMCTWKITSKKEIHKADFIIFIVGENSHKSEHINWELTVAKKAKKKIYILKLADNFKLSDEVEDVKAITEEELDSIIKIEFLGIV